MSRTNRNTKSEVIVEQLASATNLNLMESAKAINRILNLVGAEVVRRAKFENSVKSTIQKSISKQINS